MKIAVMNLKVIINFNLCAAMGLGDICSVCLRDEICLGMGWYDICEV